MNKLYKMMRILAEDISDAQDFNSKASELVKSRDLDAMHKIAGDPTTDANLLTALHNRLNDVSAGHVVHKTLAGNPNLNPKILGKYLAREGYEDAALNNPAFDLHTIADKSLMNLFDDPNDIVLMAHSTKSPHLLNLLADHPDKNVKELAYGNSHMPEDRLKKYLSNTTNTGNWPFLSLHPKVPAQTLTTILNSIKNEDNALDYATKNTVLSNLIIRKDLKPEHFDILASILDNPEYEPHHFYIARNKTMPGKILDKLSLNYNGMALMYHPNTPAKKLEQIARRVFRKKEKYEDDYSQRKFGMNDYERGIKNHKNVWPKTIKFIDAMQTHHGNRRGFY